MNTWRSEGNPIGRLSGMLQRSATLAAVLLGHGALAAWMVSAVAPPDVPPQPIRMDVRLVRHQAPADAAGEPVSAPSPAEPRVESLDPKWVPAPPELLAAIVPESVIEESPPAQPEPKPEPKPTHELRPQTEVQPVPSGPAPVVKVADSALQLNRSAASAAHSGPGQATNASPALVGARFDADYLRNPAPVYPPMSRRRGEQGEVRLLVMVGVNGAAQRVEVSQSSGYPRLDEAALRAVREWRFVPARRGDQPVAATVVVPIEFRLNT